MEAMGQGMEAETRLMEAIGSLKNRLEKNPALMLEGAPEAETLSMAQMIECLPAEMWRRIDGEGYVETLEEIATWGKMTLVVHTPDIVLEFSGGFPPGKLGHGFYNLMGESGLHGHLRPGNCGGIYLVKRPFMGRPSASLQFVNTSGAVIFKVYLGRGEDKEIFPHQIAAMEALGEKYAGGA
ncbi:MAG: heme utilization cystosolic carrier protein HutX [Candidatus Accumulibacter sp.]|jgi:putative heme utilization carrier protein HutX|nr:heme utilization cystosolic carrier protein HutX [Accumulibacter sp.]